MFVKQYDSCRRGPLQCAVFANDRRAASKIVLRIVETPSCTRKNINIRSHAGYNNASPNGGDTSYTCENLSNRSYIQKWRCSYKPAKHCKTVRLWSYWYKNNKNTINQAKPQLKARRRRKFLRIFSLRAYPIAPPPGEGGSRNYFILRPWSGFYFILRSYAVY